MFSSPPLDLARINASFTSTLHKWRVAASGSICLEELSTRFPTIPLDAWLARFELGGIYVDGARASPNQVLVPGACIEYYELHFEPAAARRHFPQITSDMVLFQDEDFAVVFKPSGLPSTAPRDQVQHTVQVYLGELLGKVVHLPSRLDVAVSGLMLASLSTRMNRHFQRAYERRLVEKYYLAEIAGRPDWSAKDVAHSIGRSSNHPILRQVDAEHGDPAQTHLLVLGSLDGDHTLVRAEPLTGRTHQIRLHCSAEGYPIVGDPYYGGREARHLHLVSFALGVFHPWRQERLYIELPERLRPEWLGPFSGLFGEALLGRRFAR